MMSSSRVITAIVVTVAVLGGTALVLFGPSLPRTAPVPSADRPPNVLLIVIDALRADHLGCYGNKRIATPHIDRFAREGVLFEQAYAQASWTKSSVASMLTGFFPYRLGVFTELGEGSVLPDEADTIAERLRARGYATCLVSANPYICPQHGFAQGFSHVACVPPSAPDATARVRDRTVTALRKKKEPSPFFMYVHFLDPHDPYTRVSGCEPGLQGREVEDQHVLAGEAFVLSGEKRLGDRMYEGAIPEPLPLEPEELGYLRDLYACEVTGIDRAVGAIRSTLEEEGFLSDTLVIITSDHGEEFLEHGHLRHGYQLFEETVRVPLIVRFPHHTGSAARYARPVGLIDLFPTILALTSGRGAPEDAGGGAHVGVLPPFAFASASEPPGEVLALGMTRWRNLDRAFVRTRHGKLIVDFATGEKNWYDLARDPGENHPLSLSKSPHAAEALAALERIIRESEQNAYPPATPPRPSPEETEQLRSLGYVQ